MMNFHTFEDNPVDKLRRECGQLLVHRAIDRDDWISQGILDIAAGNKTNWTPQQWDVLLTDMHASRIRVSDWLDLNT